MSDSLSYLPSLLSGLTGATDPLLSAIYGQSSSGPTAQSALQALSNAEQNQTQEIAATAAQPSVARTIASFTQAVNGATSVDQLLSDPTVMNVLLTANGLGDQTDYKALATKALESDVNHPDSLVNQLSDTRWKTVASTYNFATQGLAAIQTPQAIAAISQAYAQTVWEQNEDAATPGLANALSFKATAASVTSVDQILGDPTMRTVVTTALGIPQQIAFQSINAQEKAITDRLDVTKLQDPQFVEDLAQRYLIANVQNSSSSSSSTPDMTTLAIQAGGILV
jgi:hypothetical protein